MKFKNNFERKKNVSFCLSLWECIFDFASTPGVFEQVFISGEAIIVSVESEVKTQGGNTIS